MTRRAWLSPGLLLAAPVLFFAAFFLAPLAVVAQGVTGFLDEDLAHACRAALTLDRHAVREHALTRSWDSVASDLLASLVPLTPGAELARPLIQPG